MKKIITLTLFSFFITIANAQTIANVEGVFGGSISAITGGKIGTSTDSFKVIIATQSANSIFYSNAIVSSSGGAVSVDSFKVLPAASSSAGFGSGINKIAYHALSKTVFFISAGNIYSASLSTASATKITTTSGYTDIAIKGNQIFEMSAAGNNNTFYAGTINSSGSVAVASSATIVGQGYTSLVIGKNDKLYAFKNGTDPQAVVFANTITAGINLSSTTIDAMPSLSTSITWSAMAVYTDGTVFVGGNDNTSKYVSKTATLGAAYTTVATGIAGNSGSNIDFRRESATNYYVYFGSAYSNAKGNINSWFNFGNTSFQTHPNDGTVFFVAESPTSGGVVLLTTDQGLGITKNSGSVITEIDEGINAVQVKDFDMNKAKDFGWLASKSGIRYVNNYNTAAKSWSVALFPNSDGSPYYSCEMVSKDTAYVGNSRVYKTTNRGVSWTQVFTAQNTPYSFPQTNANITTLAIGGNNNEIVMAGYKLDNGAGRGGVFYSTNSGTSWQQLLIHSSTTGQDVNVNDIEIVSDSGKVVAYIGVDYDNTVTPTIRGMYKAQWNGASWTVREEKIYNAATALFSVKDIVIVSKDTIVAGGAFYNATLHHEYPIHFAISRTTMNTWSSSVVDTSRVGGYSAVSWNKDSIFYAYQNNIYWDKLSFHSTYVTRRGEALYYSVPVGTDINILYYDELLAGTETDIRSVRGATTTRPTATIKARYNVCTTTVITGGSPEGGVYYLVDTLAQGYYVQVDGLYNLLFATNGILTGESSLSFDTYAALVAAFPATYIVAFNPITTFSSTPGTYIIAYTNDSYATSSVSAVASVANSPTVSSITGSLTTCGSIGSSNTLANATSGGVWESANTSVATINNTGKVIVVNVGSSVISYTVTIDSTGCSAVAIANYTIAGLPNITPITANSNSICRGGTIQLSCTTSGGVWSSLSTLANVSTIGLVTGLASSTSPAGIQYTVTNSSTGCSNNSNYTVLINALPNVPSIAYAAGTVNPQTGANSSFCNGRTFTVVGTPIGGVWTSSNTSVLSVANGLIILLNTGTATLKYTVTNASGCTNSRSITGSVSNCAAKGINSEQLIVNSSDFTMFPNPVHSLLTINYSLLTGSGSIVIIDLYGKQIKTQPLSMGTNTVDISSIKKGFYLVNIITNNGVITKKLAVE